MSEDTIKKWALGIVLILFIIIVTTLYMNDITSNYNLTSIGINQSKNQLLIDANTISNSLSNITGQSGGETSYLTSMKNSITSTFIFLTNIPSYYRAFFESLTIELGLPIDSQLLQVLFLAISISILLAIGILILKIFI